jgi:hypothetical protein
MGQISLLYVRNCVKPKSLPESAFGLKNIQVLNLSTFKWSNIFKKNFNHISARMFKNKLILFLYEPASINFLC